MSTKHWIEPNGIFAIYIPIEWQYKNSIIENVEEKSPYSFEAYEDSIGCFQISCYPLKEKGVNPNFPIQKSDSKIEWFSTDNNDKEFDICLWGAQIEDHVYMAKCVYENKYRNSFEVQLLIKQIQQTLDTLRIVKVEDRSYAINLNKYYNFIGSLASSYDLREKAIKSRSYIEIIAVISNQIDAFLRMSILLKKQILNSTDDIEVKYLFQSDDERGMMERAIYKEAKELEIIDEIIFNELNELYDLRNRVIHRYIISHLKTIDIAEISLKYFYLSEKINLVLKLIEEEQCESGVGMYGKHPKNYEPTADDQKIAFSMANDKHLLDEFQRQII